VAGILRPIPAGHIIHHKDWDFANNDIANLECLSVKQHRRKYSEGHTFTTPIDQLKRPDLSKRVPRKAKPNLLAFSA